MSNFGQIQISGGNNTNTTSSSSSSSTPTISDSLGFKLSNVADDIKDIRYKIKNNNLFLVNRINRFVPLIYAGSNGNANYKVKYSRGIFLLLQINIFTQNRFSAFVFKSLLFVYKRICKLLYKYVCSPNILELLIHPFKLFCAVKS